MSKMSRNKGKRGERTDEGRPHWRYKGPLRAWNTLTLERPKDASTNVETASAEYVW